MSQSKKTKAELRKANRERQQKYRAKQKQLGLKQVNLYINVAEITAYEKLIRELSQTLMTGKQPSPKRQELQNLADFLKAIM